MTWTRACRRTGLAVAGVASLLVLAAWAGAEGTAAAGGSAFAEPATETLPKVRWVWPGSAVEDGELRREVGEMNRAGIGGAEISNMQWGLPAEGNPPETCLWGTDFWADRFRAALLAGREHQGFGFDLTLGPAWPWASPAVTGENAGLSQQELVRGEQLVEGPSTYAAEPPHATGVGASDATLVAVTAARVDGPDDRMLDPRETVDLTPGLDAQGRVRWEVPPGRWTVFGFWHQSTGQQASGDMSITMRVYGLSLPAVCETPQVVDHLRSESARAALSYLDDNLLDDLGSARHNLRQVFEESLELKARGPLWTSDFLREFRARRGYDLTPYLPVLKLEGEAATLFPESVFDFPGAASARVRADYHKTVTDLWVDEHLLTTSRWARKRGLALRAQVYGNWPATVGLDNIALAKAVDIPETEDLYANSMDFFRTISSGAHLSGARRVSMEYGVAQDRDHMITLAELKRRADKAFVSGVNQLILAVYPYRDANGAGWPSWNPWSSEDTVPEEAGFALGYSDGWNTGNPQWPHLKPLTAYIGRAQAVLRAGRPVSDVAVYRDLYGYPSGAQSEDAPEPALNTSLARAGLTYDFVNPGTLAERDTTVQRGRLLVQRPGYKALVVDLRSSRMGLVDHSRAIPASVARRLVSFSKARLPIVFVGELPERGVSFRAPAREDSKVRNAVASLSSSPYVRVVADDSAVPAALADLGVDGDLSFDAPQSVHGMHRETPYGDYWFLWNSGSERARFVGSFEAARRAPEVWDLWSGERRRLGLYRVAGSRVEVPLELAPRESVVIGFRRKAEKHVSSTDRGEVVVRKDKLFLRSTDAGVARATLGDGKRVTASFGTLPGPIEPAGWDLHVEGAVPEGEDRHDIELAELKDWREIAGLEHSSGMGTYRAEVSLDDRWSGKGNGAYLELGRVEGGVQVRVNGRLASPASVSLPRFDVGGLLSPGMNTIEVQLTTTLKNRMVALAHAGLSEFARFLARPETQPYGLIGPVRLVPYAERRIG